MKLFRFPLERVLEWRRMELEQAEARFKQQAAALAEIDRERAEAEAAELRMEIQVRAWRPVWGGDLTALGAFRLAMQKCEEVLHARRVQCKKELSARQEAMLEARRRLRLLERLKEKRLAEWRRECDRETEAEAAEAYLAGWGR
jgi:hypothetical protein